MRKYKIIIAIITIMMLCITPNISKATDNAEYCFERIKQLANKAVNEQGKDYKEVLNTYITQIQNNSKDFLKESNIVDYKTSPELRQKVITLIKQEIYRSENGNVEAPSELTDAQKEEVSKNVSAWISQNSGKSNYKQLLEAQLNTEGSAYTQEEAEYRKALYQAEYNRIIAEESNNSQSNEENNSGGISVNPITDPNYYKPGPMTDYEEWLGIGNIIIGAIRALGTIIAVVALMAIGLRYMFGSAAEKASYKETMIPYLIGAVMLLTIPNLLGIIYDLVKGINF